jgi:hypothetical protein
MAAMSFGKIKVEGVPQLKTKLRNIAQKVPDHAARVMRSASVNIVTLSQLQCPHDKGNLEESIHSEEKKDGRRLAIDIVAGGTVNGENIDDYATLIHENYESMKPGPNTLAKMAANPGILIGSKFIQRAVDASDERLRKSMIEAIEVECQI